MNILGAALAFLVWLFAIWVVNNAPIVDGWLHRFFGPVYPC